MFCNMMMSSIIKNTICWKLLNLEEFNQGEICQFVHLLMYTTGNRLPLTMFQIFRNKFII